MTAEAWTFLGIAVTAISGVVAAGFKFAVDIRARLGDPNGNGDIVKMLTRLIDGQAGQDLRLAKLEHGQAEHGERISRIERQLHDVLDEAG